VPSTEPTVCAIAPPAADLACQTRPPDGVVVNAAGARGLAGALTTATVTHDATWLWLLDDDVVPAPDALEQLLAPLTESTELADPVLLSGMVVGPDGRMDAERLPWPRLLARELAMAGAERHLAALRAACYGSLLVHRRAIERHGGPRADFAGEGEDLEWTGRILRDEPGYLVPGSAARRARNRPLDLRRFTRNRVRILRGDGWRGQERAWFAFLLAQDVAQRLAARPTSTPALARAIGSGLRAGS